MGIRIISFLAGALFGAGGALLNFRFLEHSAIDWRIVALAAVVLGGFAAAFGKKFWDTAIGIWP